MNSRVIKIIIVAGLLAGICLMRFDRMPAAASSAADSDRGYRVLLDRKESFRSARSVRYALRGAKPGRNQTLLVSLTTPASLSQDQSLAVTLREGQRVIAGKALHAADADLYVPFILDKGDGEIEISSPQGIKSEILIRILEWDQPAVPGFAIESEPNDNWREADEIAPGQTVWASADDKPYIQHQSEAEARKGIAPYQQIQDAARDLLPPGGVDWYRFSYDGDGPKLAHFELNLLERDNIPVDVSVFTVEAGEIRPYDRGADPVTPPHEVQALPGNKFTTRIITRGTYYLRVDANHVFYQLKTALYDPPPYGDPRKAVRAAMDYLVSAGDSWHANTPRHGGLVTRVSSNHHETMLCIACHATHFTTRAELTAARNGYEVKRRASLDFLVERLSNNPLPLYGQPEASWTRVISASANVLSRLSMLVNQYDEQFTGLKRLPLLKGVAGYLKLYYKGRTELPPDESNGNTPLVSAYEVAWYSWKVFDELGRWTGDKDYLEYRDRIRDLISRDRIKNNIDLCWQTIALAEIDRAAYAAKIEANVARILSLQRPDGQWSMLFDPASLPVEFQTYHCLYALARAGLRADDPRIAGSLRFLLSRQQEWGGWFDPLQSYENFRTPFRETQFAVMALSEFYHASDGGSGGGGGGTSSGIAARLMAADETVSRPGGGADVSRLIEDLRSGEPMLRMAAAAALGRAGAGSAIAPLASLLGDPSKLVQIAAAQAIRRIASRDQSGTDPILLKPGDRASWGATRIFAQHFSSLTTNRAHAERLLAMLDDPYILVRMQAARSLVQWYYWSRDAGLRDKIADAFVDELASSGHPWMRRNLMEGLYSLADENVRYLYNNWIGHLPQQADRDAVTAGHREESRRMAERIARALETGNDLQREGVLRGLTEFHLRSGGYVNAGRYTRIGNDVETVVFYSNGAPALERALLPLLESKDANLRRQAVLASFTLRDNRLESLPLQVMRRLDDPESSVRAAADEFYRSLPLSVVEGNRRQAIEVLKSLLASEYTEARVAALGRVGALGDERMEFDDQVRAYVLNSNPRISSAALRSLADFAHLAADPRVAARVASALQTSDEALLRAAAELVLKKPELAGIPAIAAAIDSLPSGSTAAGRKLILGLINADTNPQAATRLRNLLTVSLGDQDDSVRIAALNAVKRSKPLQADAAVRSAVQKLIGDRNPRLQEMAREIYPAGDAAARRDPAAGAERLLDFGFFVDRVMPVLARKGPDGAACVNCHVTHAIFKLNEPDRNGIFTEAQLQENYRYAMKVVDLANPENSLILRKPTSDSSVEGIAGARRTAHGGGTRWQGGVNDPAYQTVLEWINGARR